MFLTITHKIAEVRSLPLSPQNIANSKCAKLHVFITGILQNCSFKMFC